MKSSPTTKLYKQIFYTVSIFTGKYFTLQKKPIYLTTTWFTLSAHFDSDKKFFYCLYLNSMLLFCLLPRKNNKHFPAVMIHSMC